MGRRVARLTSIDDRYVLFQKKGPVNTTMFVQSWEEDYMAYPEYALSKYLLFYVPPILLILGTFGNVFSFFILMKNVKKASTYSYLSALAIMDLLVLYIGLLRLWIGQFTMDFRNQADWVCKLIVFLGYVCSDTSVWLIIAVTAERFFVVYFPLHAPRLCNVRNARIVIVCIFLLFSSINGHFLWSVELEIIQINETVIMDCHAPEAYNFLVNVMWPWIDAVIYSFVPFVLILAFNILIIRQVFMAKKTRSKMLQMSACQRHLMKPIKYKTQCETSRKITCMLLVISFTFLLTTLPVNITLIVTTVNSHSEDDQSFAKIQLANTLTQLLMYTNHCINFFLYCATGRKFREQFRTLACYICSGKWLRKCFRDTRRNRGSFRLYKMNTSSGVRTIYVDCERPPIKGTLL